MREIAKQAQCRFCTVSFQDNVPFGHNAFCAGLSEELQNLAADVMSKPLEIIENKRAWFALLDVTAHGAALDVTA